MKTIVLILSGMLLLTSQSKATDAEAIFKAENGKSMILYMDGKQMNAIPKNVIVINDLKYGNHFVSVKVLDRRTSQLVKKPIYLKKFHQSSFEVNSIGPRGHIDIVKIKEVPNLNRWKSREKRNPKVRVYRNYNSKMVNMKFFMHQLENARFDHDKVRIAKLMLSQKLLTTRDLIVIMNNISFETNKLDIAIFAYPHVIDKRNFYKVENTLRFKSSIQRLRISTYRSTKC